MTGVRNPNNLLTIFTTNFSELVDLMKNTDHGTKDKLNPYHMEGSIYTHTLMVFKEATTRYPNDFLLHIATLLHDIGKCFVREEVYDEKTNITKVRFFGHEGVSVFKASSVLNSKAFEVFNLKYEEKTLILSTISLHGSFFDYFHDEKHLLKLIDKFKGNVTLFDKVTKHLICDHLGRICMDEHNANELINLDCAFYSKLEAMSNAFDHKMLTQIWSDKSNIVLLVGPPCSGKSTKFNHLYSDYGYTKISRDDMLMKLGSEKFPGKGYSEIYKLMTEDDHKNLDKALYETYQKAIVNNENIVIDMTNMSAKSRRRWLSDNRIKKNYNTTALVFYVGEHVLLERNTKRYELEGKNIPNGVFLNMFKNFTTPLYDEVDQITYILN